jgi:hypothetical protein
LNSFDEDQDVEGALQYLGLTDLQQRYKDLSVTLMPHVSVSMDAREGPSADSLQQVLGVKFMIEQEKKPRMKGGILAGGSFEAWAELC